MQDLSSCECVDGVREVHPKPPRLEVAV